MAVRREAVSLHFDADSFTGRWPLLAAAAKKMSDEMAAQQATWEPHDWSDF